MAAEVSYNNAWYTLGGGLGRKAGTAKSYTPFGEQIGEATSGFGYNGEYYSAATGMIYLRARFYAPEMNRFSQKDTLRGSVTQPGSLNRYAYCQNDPVNFMDPSGMRQVAGMYGDGTGRTSTAKQTTPIITKPSQSKAASVPANNRTVAVPVTDTGTGSYKRAASAAKNASNTVSNAAYTGYTGDTATPTSWTSHNSGPFTSSPSVSSIGIARSFGCGKTINALGAGDYEGIAEVIRVPVNAVTPIYDYASDIERIDFGHARIVIDSAQKRDVNTLEHIIEIGLDFYKIYGLSVITEALIEAAPATGGASLIAAQFFLESTSAIGVGIVSKIADTFNDYNTYQKEGVVVRDFNLLPESSSLEDIFKWIIGV